MVGDVESEHYHSVFSFSENELETVLGMFQGSPVPPSEAERGYGFLHDRQTMSFGAPHHLHHQGPKDFQQGAHPFSQGAIGIAACSPGAPTHLAQQSPHLWPAAYPGSSQERRVLPGIPACSSPMGLVQVPAVPVAQAPFLAPHQQAGGRASAAARRT